jgi:hypothetical protein
MSSGKPIVTEVLGTFFFFPLLPGHLILLGAKYAKADKKS